MHPVVSIHWPNDKKRIDKVLRTGIIPSLKTPGQLKVPGGTVALVDDKQNVLLVGKIESIDKKVKITDLEGNKVDGRHLIMNKASLRRPRKGDCKKLAVLTKWLGSFYYLDERMRPINSTGGGLVKAPQEFHGERNIEFQRFNAEKLASPERELISQYKKWIGEYNGFSTPVFKAEGIVGDLFISRFYCLVEAKASPQRNDMRKAMGQLFDYQFCFELRRPSLAYLVDARPRPRDIELLKHRKITVIWKTPSGRFSDSSDGKYTTEFRKMVRCR